VIFVDGLEVGDVEDVALRDRRMLSNDGVFIVVATVSEQTGESISDAEISFRGVPFMAEADDMIEDLKDVVDRSIADLAKKVQNSEGVSAAELREKLHNDVARFVYERTKRRPMVLPVIVEI
jgi:ribonuclease J